MSWQPGAREAEGWLADIGEDVRDSLAVLDRLAGTVDGSALSLLKLLDEIERLSADDRDYIVWLAAIERSTSGRASEAPPSIDTREGRFFVLAARAAQTRLCVEILHMQGDVAHDDEELRDVLEAVGVACGRVAALGLARDWSNEAGI